MELNEWWNDSRALFVLVDPVPALSSTFHMWCENIAGAEGAGAEGAGAGGAVGCGT